MIGLLNWVHDALWGAPSLVLILGTGVWLSLRTRGAQLRYFGRALGQFAKKFTEGPHSEGVSSYQSLCTALSATVGTGNIAGVAGAICLGGPGAVFWMLVSALLGMVIKLAEVTLAVRYRIRDGSGQLCGGPMYMIRLGMGKRFGWLATVYAVCGLVAALGVGNATQINAVLEGLRYGFSLEAVPARDLLICLAVAILVAYILLGGAKRVGRFAERIVPLASCAYVALCLGVIVMNLQALPSVLGSVLSGAFSPKGITGGAVGSAFIALRTGVCRGVFSNEAGMGTGCIAHASAEVDHPIKQGLMGIVEVFIDTVVICSVTALAILCSGVSIPYGTDQGVVLTTRALCGVYGGWSGMLLAVFLCAFAFATMLGWGFYGLRFAEYLFGKGARLPFVVAQSTVILTSCFLKTGVVWLLAETVNGLMAIPNLIALIYLCPSFVRILHQYQHTQGGHTAQGGAYESFHQCKPLRALSHAKVSPVGGRSGTPGEADLSS